MTSTAAQPTIPARPTRGSDKDNSSSSMPMIPPRPSSRRRASDRSVSPGPDRFAPSPLNENFLTKTKSGGLLSPAFSPKTQADTNEGNRSMSMPSVGEEGMEYRALSRNLERDEASSASLEQTSTVSADLHLHAPKPSLPASTAKQQVSLVTRTDSDRAASFGIGRSHAEERALSRDGIRKKASTTFSGTSDQQIPDDDEHGIPEIGQRVPMNPNLGDVQAPSPAPSETTNRHHNRKHSARAMPPGSYGLHGHGVTTQDKFERAYYQKHPDAFKREEHTHIHDRQNDYAMSSAELNRLVRDTANRSNGAGSGSEFRATPSDDVAFQASEEYATRIASPRSNSRARPSGEHRGSTSLAKVDSHSSSVGFAEPLERVNEPRSDGEAIHIDESKHREYRSFGNEDLGRQNEEYYAPILAPDEVSKDPSGYYQQPAVHPRPGSADIDEAPGRPVSRPASIHQANSQAEVYQTPLEDVEEYEPLFPEETTKQGEHKKTELAADENKNHYHFPSKDIWEDAPSSVHYTATVSTPDLPATEQHKRTSSRHDDHTMTPAHLFAKHQEELAEKDARRRSAGSYLSPTEERSSWAAHQNQSHLKAEKPSSNPRFPSQDIWEDVPESQLHEATLSSPSAPTESKPDIPMIPARPVRKSSPAPMETPTIPERPKSRQTAREEKQPQTSQVPQAQHIPQIPARPVRGPAREVKEDEAESEPKPAVARGAMGGKLAALQAGFMSDLNRRLQLGPATLKKEEPKESEAVVEEKEKVPLVDARKGRARGPQRRAPAKSAAPPAKTEPPKPSVIALSFSVSQSIWSIDPDDGDVLVGGKDKVEKSVVDVEKTEEVKGVPESVDEKKSNIAPDPVASLLDLDIEEGVEGGSAEESKSPTANIDHEYARGTTVDVDDKDIFEPVRVRSETKP